MNGKQLLFSIPGLIFSFFIIPAILIWVGYSHVGPLFTGEFTQQLGSIEISYIQMAQFLQKSLPQFAWQPLWYLGYPMELLYTPFVPFFEFATHLMFGWSFSHAYRFLTACAYVGTLVTLYFFARALFKNSAAGFVTALIYGILPSIIAFLYPSVAKDRFIETIVEPRRFTILVRWGEGPHIVSLMFLFLAGWGLLSFLRGGRKRALLSGTVMTGMVFLTNSIGAWGFVLLAFTLLIGTMVEETKQWRSVLLRFFFFALIAFGLISFWFNPLFLSSFFREGGGSLSYWRDQFPWGWLLLIFVLSAYFFISTKLFARTYGVTAAILFFLLMFSLVNTYYASDVEKIELVPQVLRLTTEVDVGSGLLAGAFISMVGAFIVRKNKWVYLGAMGIVACGGFVLMLPTQLELARQLPQFTQPLETVGKTLEQTPEYEVAQNLKNLVVGGERVMVPGNYGFYLNYFVDIPQLRGALFQSSIHRWPDHMYYQLTNGKDGDVTAAWMKIANVGWLVYGGPREIFLDYKVGPEKFDEVGEMVKENFGDRYYKIALTDSSLAKAISEVILDIPTPTNAIDKVPIFEYRDLLDVQKNKLTLTETQNGTYDITGTVDTDEIVLVQMAYTPGWSAKDGTGQKLAVQKDPLGFIAITPKTQGQQNIRLVRNKTWRTWIGWLISIVTVGGVVFLLIISRKPLFVLTPHVHKKAADEDA